ncbi:MULTISPECIES: 4-hydroxyphenylacetate 3-hydroxylase N-terminal domain-containing protein [Paenibacillus]|uniref:4-hydroxyphenylacetate 3-hydroxylase family protein n=1 Tax=Paenibacillus TaxID=44249 RepID=UPI0012BA2A4F|nr:MULTISPECIES: 4-hydroxyphenylacetate 3-hydroxylase N-terminal domain-containing protein [Paenibacillus]MCM3133190.1 4-hydroxyphenylacetate 3-monooxygenase, oxygenase component [Paenibacillus polysaccharolyticus]MDP9697239.1 4-hydroxyphenylacetate 3-monooxygenase [Paenibacillus intestini]
MPAKTGMQYCERINAQTVPCWYKGELLTAKRSEHIAFSGLMKTQMNMYDLQYDPQLTELMTYPSPTDGKPVGMSFLPPTSVNDLRKRREAMTIWAQTHHGFLGRSPDYMNTAMMAFFTAADLLNDLSPQYAENLRNYYAYCRDHDITLSHAFIQPHASKISGQMDATEDAIAAKVVDRTDEGLIINGAFMMATQAATSDEIFVYPSPSPAPFDDENPFAFSFAVPNDLPGITLICRDTYAAESNYNYPLSSRYEEMDNIVIFDHVLVPHNRIFFAGHEQMSSTLFSGSNFHIHAGHQVLCRYIAKTEFMLGTIQLLTDTLDLSNEAHVLEKTARALAGLESLKALALAAEAGAIPDGRGYILPAPKPLMAANLLYPKLYPEMIEILQLLSSSGMIMVPQEEDFQSGTADSLNVYLKGSDMESKERNALFRLIWELGAGSFGGRQTQFERFFFGNNITVSNRLYKASSQDHSQRERVRQFLGNLAR